MKGASPMSNSALPAGFVCLHGLVLVIVTRPIFSTSICHFATRVLGYLDSPRFCGSDTFSLGARGQPESHLRLVEWLYGLSPECTRWCLVGSLYE